MSDEKKHVQPNGNELPCASGSGSLDGLCWNCLVDLEIAAAWRMREAATAIIEPKMLQRHPDVAGVKYIAERLTAIMGEMEKRIGEEKKKREAIEETLREVGKSAASEE